MTRFSLDTTFWLDLLFGALTITLFVRARRHPLEHDHARLGRSTGPGAES